MMGLIEAYKRFEYQRLQLWTYAGIRIRRLYMDEPCEKRTGTRSVKTELEGGYIMPLKI